MRFRTVLSIASLLMLWSIVTLCSVPAASQVMTRSRVPEPSSVSGKIATVTDSQLTLALGRNQNPNKLNFVIDGNTKIEGSLVVGAQATVDYRADADRLVATHVVVVPASGIHAQ